MNTQKFPQALQVPFLRIFCNGEPDACVSRNNTASGRVVTRKDVVRTLPNGTTRTVSKVLK